MFDHFGTSRTLPAGSHGPFSHSKGSKIAAWIKRWRLYNLIIDKYFQKNMINIWCLNFKVFLGMATYPWDDVILCQSLSYPSAGSQHLQCPSMFTSSIPWRTDCCGRFCVWGLGWGPVNRIWPWPFGQMGNIMQKPRIYGWTIHHIMSLFFIFQKFSTCCLKDKLVIQE